MTEIQKYLAEEVAEDLADGIITRREAMRRLGLLGLSAVGGVGAPDRLRERAGAAAAARSMAHGDRGAVTTWAPIATESITFPGPRGTLMAAWAAAARPRGGVLVIHENRGLTAAHPDGRRQAGRERLLRARDRPALRGGRYRRVPGRGRGGGRPRGDPARAVRRRHEGGRDRAAPPCRRRKLAAIGFCFGGAMVWRLLTSGERRLAAAAPFYGPFPRAAARRARALPCSASTAGSTRASTRAGRRPRRRSRPPG